MSLLPPQIEGKLPAQKGNTLVIPFLDNRAVGKLDYNGTRLLIKTSSTNKIIATLSGSKDAKFTISDKQLNIGQYYKAQLAYTKGTEIGPYSSVGVFKYTAEPTVTIAGFSTSGTNFIGASITGAYSSVADATEKVYSYTFNIYDSDRNLIESSGEQLHNASSDTVVGASTDTYIPETIFAPGAFYYVEYKVITENGLEVTSPKYVVMSKSVSLLPNVTANLEAVVDRENGCINLSLVKNDSTPTSISGYYQVIRYSQGKQTILKDFVINNDSFSNKYSLCSDRTVEQGVSYQYGFRQYSTNGIYTSAIMSESVTADFEDAFLSDGERQLKIKYNPKISSFKNNIQEAKTDTIGGRYPFIFRNGRQKYKEFPISGLISYHMDEQGLFLKTDSETEPNRIATPGQNILYKSRHTNLTADNVEAERRFKLEVLEWLNNGKPKLFRSPTEGNYLVRVLNVSLSPNDTLGRMLHTFSCTAYEIAELSNKTLQEHEFTNTRETRDGTWTFGMAQNVSVNQPEGIRWIRVSGLGNTFKLTYASGNTQSIVLSSTGFYETFFEENYVTKIERTNGDADYNIEYAWLSSAESHIKHNNTNVKNVILSQAHINGSRDAVSNILFNIPCYNISYLRVSAKDNQLDSYITIIFKDNTRQEIKIKGSLVLTSKDFDGFFSPKQINIANADYDMYYIKEEIVTA